MTPKELKAARRKVSEIRSAPPAPSRLSAQLADLLLDKIEEAIGVVAELKANVLAERTRADRAEAVLESIAFNFDEDADLVPAVEAQTKELADVSGFWHFANIALGMIPGMDWDSEDCESIEPNAKRCIDALVERAARAEMELAECKKLAIGTLCDNEQGHSGPGGTIERVIALAKECVQLTSDVGETNAAFRDLCLALEAKDTKGIEAILDAKWRGKESDKDQP